MLPLCQKGKNKAGKYPIWSLFATRFLTQETSIVQKANNPQQALENYDNFLPATDQS